MTPKGSTPNTTERSWATTRPASRWSPAPRRTAIPIGMVVGTFTRGVPRSPARGVHADDHVRHLRADEGLPVVLRQRPRPRPARPLPAHGGAPAGQVRRGRVAPLSDTALPPSTTRSRTSTAGSNEVVEAGDHLIVLCEVEQMEVARPVTPLLFFQGGYGGFNPRGMTAHGDGGPHRRRPAGRGGTPAHRAPRPHHRVRDRRARRRRRPRADHRAECVRRRGGDAGAAGRAHPADASAGRGVRRVPAGRGRSRQWVRARVVQATRRSARSTGGASPTCKERGYAVSVRLARLHPAPTSDLKDAMREYAAGGLTPARERAVRSVISQTSRFFETVDIDDGPDLRPRVDRRPGAGPGRARGHGACGPASCRRACRVPRCGGWVAQMQHAAASVAEQLGRELDTRATRPTSTPSPATYMM